MAPTVRTLTAPCLLALALLALPGASAEPQACVDASCPAGYAVVVEAAGHRADACVVAVHDSCQPYDGDLVRLSVDGKSHRVPDPCYTMACF